MRISIYRNGMREIFSDYIASKHWKEVKLQVQKRDNLKCRDCHRKTKQGTVHHTSYENWGSGNFEEVNDCVWLCKKCNKKRHQKHQDGKVPFWAQRAVDMLIVERKDLEEAVNLLN